MHSSYIEQIKSIKTNSISCLFLSLSTLVWLLVNTLQLRFKSQYNVSGQSCFQKLNCRHAGIWIPISHAQSHPFTSNKNNGILLNNEKWYSLNSRLLKYQQKINVEKAGQELN